jgi:hypothetical protein
MIPEEMMVRSKSSVGGMRALLVAALLSVLAGMQARPLEAQSAGSWRMATQPELAEVLPARAPVLRERIETEMRTASGVTDGKGRFIAGVVLITAGYSADGKYSHFFLCQVPVRIGGFTLHPGPYVIGWTHMQDGLGVSFYDAVTGRLLGTADARREKSSRVDAFRMTPPGENSRIFIGRFSFAYAVGD